MNGEVKALHRNPDEFRLCSVLGWGAFMDQRRRRILLAAFAVASVVGLGGFYMMPRQGVCVKRNMMFWRTNIQATELRPNLYMLSVYGTDLINANTVALIGDEGVLLVDPGHPEMLRKQRAALPRLQDRRIRFVISSHAHQDHACANGQLFNQGAIIVSHKNARSLFETSDWAPLRGPRNSAQVDYDDEMTLRFNGEQVRLIHPSRAHTEGDTITVFERANVIHTGDIFVTGAFPYMKGSSIDGYVAAHERILSLADDRTLVVPGHGPLARRADVEKSLWRMREVRRRMTALVDEGLTKEEVLARRPLDDLQPGGGRAITNGQAVAGYVYDSLTQERSRKQ